MKEATTVKKSAVALYLKEILTNSVVWIISFLLAFLVLMGVVTLIKAVIPEEHLMTFVLTGVMVCPLVVFGISMMIDDFKKKKAQEEYNERLKWQKERLKMSFEERLRGSRQ